MSIEIYPDHDVSAFLPPRMPNSNVTSRRARTEQRKLVRQILLLGGGAIVLLVVFIFVIAPGAVQLVANILGTGQPITFNDTLPPQVPVLAAPVPATYSAELAITGYGEAGSTVVLLVNGQKSAEVKLGSDGQLSQTIALTDGENSLSTYAVDDAGNESSASRSFTIIVDREPPQIEITEPQDGQTIELRKNQNLTIKGKTEPHSRITINGRLALANSTGEFSSTYLLSEGENKLEFKVQDEAGNTADKILTVQFKF